ncbi:hypothetical protein B0H14DRAFT_910420 [Mycena olivaceomarginata]|nr:hypothetical protein B0H14DRAFT_910420 [Mycena olivaceomarginata]
MARNLSMKWHDWQDVFAYLDEHPLLLRKEIVAHFAARTPKPLLFSKKTLDSQIQNRGKPRKTPTPGDWARVIAFAEANPKMSRQQIVDHYANLAENPIAFGKEALDWHRRQSDGWRSRLKTDEEWNLIIDYADAHPNLTREEVSLHFATLPTNPLFFAGDNLTKARRKRLDASTASANDDKTNPAIKDNDENDASAGPSTLPQSAAPKRKKLKMPQNVRDSKKKKIERSNDSSSVVGTDPSTDTAAGVVHGKIAKK